jgi:DNA-binding transcriptional LysR family regulator
MEMHHLRVFVAAAEEGSLRRAAQRLYIAQPQLSQVIRKLERDLGATLLVRSPKGVELTSAGVLLLEQARTVIRDFDRLVANVRDAAAGERSITIGLQSGQMAAGELTRPILNAFRAANPKLSMMVRELNFSTQYSALENGEVDVALVRLPAPSDRLVVRPLFEEPRVLCVSRDHPLADASSVDADTVLQEAVVGLAGPTQEWTDFWLLNDLRGGPARTSVGKISSVTDLKFTLMLDASLVMPVAECAWKMGLEDPGLRMLPMTGVAPSTIAVAYRRGDGRREVVAFADCAEKVTHAMGNRVLTAPAMPTSA